MTSLQSHFTQFLIMWNLVFDIRLFWIENLNVFFCWFTFTSLYPYILIMEAYFHLSILHISYNRVETGLYSELLSCFVNLYCIRDLQDNCCYPCHYSFLAIFTSGLILLLLFPFHAFFLTFYTIFLFLRVWRRYQLSI